MRTLHRKPGLPSIEVDPRAWITSREGATPKAWSAIVEVDPRAWITSREGATPKAWSAIVEIEVDPRAWITSRELATPKAWSVVDFISGEGATVALNNSEFQRLSRVSMLNQCGLPD